MNIYKLDERILTNLKTISLNEKFLQKYIELIEKYVLNPPSENYERHHILPKSLFPEFKNFTRNKWNEVKLPYKEHLVAHYYLSILTQKREMKHSFVYMITSISTLVEVDYTLDELPKEIMEEYEKARIFVQEHIVTRDKNNNTIWVKKTDERFLSGELIGINKKKKLYNNGNINKLFTEEEIVNLDTTIWKQGKKDKSHLMGRNAYNNGKELRFFTEEEEKTLDLTVWKKGRCNIPPATGKTPYHDGTKTKYFTPEEEKALDLTLWKKGFHYKEGKNISVTNGKTQKFVTQEEYDRLDKTIWKRGVVSNPPSHKGLREYNNGIINKRFSEEEIKNLDLTVWKKGKVPKKK